MSFDGVTGHGDTCYHEVGHALSGLMLGVEFDPDLIVRYDRDGSGLVQYLQPRAHDSRGLEVTAIMAIAGPLAAERAAREGLTTGPPSSASPEDERCITHSLRMLGVPLDGWTERRRQYTAYARELVATADFWVPCRMLAETLREQGEMTMSECRRIVTSAASVRRIPQGSRVVATSSWSARAEGGIGRVIAAVTVGELFYDVSPEVKARPERFRSLGAGELVYRVERPVVVAYDRDGYEELAEVRVGQEVAGIHPCVTAERDAFCAVVAA